VSVRTWHRLLLTSVMLLVWHQEPPFCAEAARTELHGAVPRFTSYTEQQQAGARFIAPVESHTTIDVVAVDGRGRPVADLRPGEFIVSVNGKPGRVIRATYVFRGPGAEAAAAAGIGRTALTPVGREVTGEVERTLLFVLDQDSIAPGDERTVRELVIALLDRLGPDDGVGFVLLPPAEGRLAIDSDRESVREALARVRGRAAQPQERVSERRDEPERKRADQAEEEEVEKELEAEKRRAELTRRDEPGEEAMLVAHQIRARSSAAMRALESLMNAMTDLRGPKTLVFLSGGLIADRQSPELSSVAAAAASSRTNVVAFQVGQALQEVRMERGGPPVRPQDGLAAVAAATGGSLFSARTRKDVTVERFFSGISGVYVLRLDVDGPPIPEGPPAHVLVRTSRRGVVLHTRQVLAARHESAPWPAALSEPPEKGQALSAPPVTGRTSRPAGRGPVQNDELRLLLAKAAEYVASYERELSSVVAEEHYEQILTGLIPDDQDRLKKGQLKRSLRSDFLLVVVRGEEGWTPFRDVFEVDGVEIRDRTERLQRLFLESPGTAMRAARSITDESARYNLGWSIRRNVNVPTLPLLFLQSGQQSRFLFTLAGDETLRGVRTRRIDYEEQGRPTIIRTSSGDDIPVQGRFWIDPINGRVVRTLLTSGEGAGHSPFRSLAVPVRAGQVRITVAYGPDQKLGLWVPTEMEELYEAKNERVRAVARYSNIRRFRVLVDEKLGIQK
jgi:hypothetical protein